MQKWEYKAESNGRLIGAGFVEDFLNNMGEAGWELVFSYEKAVKRVYIFKRPKKETQS
jgi:hypothetical protein